MNINIKKRVLESIIDEYNLDSSNHELELIYKQKINENVLNKLIQYLVNKFNSSFKEKPNISVNDLKIEYILDIYIDNISKEHRLSFKSDENILKKHCINEKNNIETSTFSDDYILEYKTLISKYNIDDLNCRINLKKEYREEDKQIISDFNQNYQKFQKYYRLKKRISLDFVDFKIDITIVKADKGYNLVLSDIVNKLEEYEIEVEIMNKEITVETITNILTNYFIVFKQFNSNGYFILNDSEANIVKKNYFRLISNYVTNSIGPKPITLTKKTIHNMKLPEELTKNLEDPLSNKIYYKITEKADGERYIMYIDKSGILYLINDNNNLILTGLKLDLNIDKHKVFVNSILDGEYLYYKDASSGKKSYSYKYFDIYILNNRKVFNESLSERIKHMDKLNEILNSDEIIKYQDKDKYIVCSSKSYHDINKLEELSAKDKYPYHIDGFIFMPTTSLSTINNVTYREMLKYKPISENSLDVYIKDKTLYCGYNILYNRNKKYVLAEVLPIKPYIFNFHKPNNIYDDNLKEINWNKINKKVIEVRYDNDSDKIIFMKIRYDKTLKYNNDKTVTANNYNIINDIITYNFNPLEPSVMNNLNIDIIDEINNLNNKNNYYKLDNKQRDKKNSVRGINNDIKRQLIDNSMTILEFIQTKKEDFNFIKVLDLACGRGGDLKKFLDTNYVNNNPNNNVKEKQGIKFVLGIDYDSMNIEFYDDKTQANNNARARYVSYKNTTTHLEKSIDIPDIYKNNSVYYITGDMNLHKNDDKSIEDIYYTLMNKEHSDFNRRVECDKKLLDDIKEYYKDTFDLYEEEQFELISCQFAIHYFNLNNFAHLVNKNLKEHGLFICTFMNKEYVEDLMLNKDIVSGNFWSLKKSEDTSKILVNFETLEEDYKEEALISKEDIIDAFAEYSIKPYVDISTQLDTNRNYTINGIFDFKDYHKLKYNGDFEAEFSKLYTYIIFQKNTITEDVLQNLTKS